MGIGIIELMNNVLKLYEISGYCFSKIKFKPALTPQPGAF